MTPAEIFSLSGKKTAVLSLLAGTLVSLSLAPFNFWPAGIVSLFLLLHCLQHSTPKYAWFTGWLFGMGMFGAGTSWVYVSIHQFGHAPIPLAVFLTLLFTLGLALLFCSTFAYCYVRLFSHKRLGVLLGFPALWVIFEWLRSWVFTGFPWLFIGYAHTDTWLGNLAPVTGVYGLSLVISLAAAALYQLAFDNKRNHALTMVPVCTAILLLPWAIGYGLINKQWVNDNGEAIKVTLLQPNISQSVKWRPEQRSETLRLMYRETKKHLDSDIIIWPENGIPLFYHQAKGYLQAIRTVAAEKGTTILSGIPYWEINDAYPGGVMHNSVIALDQTPEDQFYHKQKLVPFGEYVPLEDQLRGLISFFDLPMSDFRPGSKKQMALELTIKGKQVSIAAYVCYEIVYPDFVRNLGKGSDILLTISDDSWFGKSIGPRQHMQMARMRALENGRYLVRGTNTGITAIVDYRGKIIADASQFESTSLTGDIKITTGQTPFMKWGSLWTLLTCSALLIITFLIPGRSQKQAA